MRFFQISLLAVVCLSASLSSPSFAAPAAEVSVITTMTKNLLEQARTSINSRRAYYKDIQAHPERYEDIRTGILDDRDAALQQKNLRAAELAAAIQAKEEILATQLVLPHAVQFHQGMLNLVSDYKGQACAPGGNPALCVGGDWSHRRGAMGAIIDSQADDVQALEAINDDIISRAAALATELRDTSANPTLLNFGTQHYVDNRRTELEMLRDTVQAIAPLFDGKTLEGQTTTIYLPCLIGTQIPLHTFRDELLQVRTAAGLFQDDHDGWADFMSTFVEYYDGSTQSPGILSHWAGCMSSKQLQISTLQAALNQAISEGNLALAAIFDSNINQLQQDIRKLAAERSILLLRRGQLSSILSSESAQYDASDPGNHTWVSTVLAHSDNLIKGMLTYPTALRGMRAVLIDLISALNLLTGIADPTLFKDSAAATSVHLNTGIEQGLSRLKTELNFTGTTVLPNLAQAIRIGESALTSNIDTYEGILSLHFQAVQQELSTLPSRLALAVQIIAAAQTNFNNADQFVRDLDAALLAHDASMAAINAAATSLEGLLGVARFNPLYTDLANSYLMGLRTEKSYKKFAPQIQSSVKKLLKSFNGSSRASSAIFRCKNRKGACSNALVRKAVLRRDQFVSQLPSLLDGMSRPYLSGNSIGEYMATITQQNASIMSRAH